MCFEIFVLSEKYFIKQRILQYHTHLKGRVVYLQKKLENYIIKYFKGDKEYKGWTHHEEPKKKKVFGLNMKGWVVCPQAEMWVFIFLSNTYV